MRHMFLARGDHVFFSIKKKELEAYRQKISFH